MNSWNNQAVMAFKKAICAEMGKSDSSLFAIQTLPIAWNLAVAMGWAAKEFCLKVGFSELLMEHQGFITTERPWWDTPGWNLPTT